MTTALVVVVLLGSAHLRSYDAPHLDPRPALLPVYLLLSLARLGTAYAVAVLLALAVGHLAARSAFARKLILPTLDVLQSVPILGFFPVAVAFFIGLFQGSALGVEAAAVFLIFTCMFWNLAFAVYESLITVPEDLTVAAAQLGLRGSLRWSRLVMPAVVPNLLSNSRLSWANGWYFLIASEIIAVGPARYTLPGLGSYLAEAVTVGHDRHTVLALAVLVVTTVAMHVLLWAPLEMWAERFHLDESGDHPRTPRLGQSLARSRIARWVGRRVIVPSAQQALGAAGRLLGFLGSHERVSALLLALGIFGGVAVLGRYLYGVFLLRPLGPDLFRIPLDLLASFLRVVAALAISAVLSIPLAHLVTRNPRWRLGALAVIQILASIPAAAFFPLIVIAFASGLGMNAGALVLALTTMFWYVLFNVMGAAAALPKETREAAQAFGLRGMRYLRRVFVPAVLPGLITGCITAWGAGWNAMILCEYLVADGRVYRVRGIGATLAQATYVSGDMQLVAACLLSMVTLMILGNRLVWQPLYQRAAARYKMDA
jgi:NitT/TauT family transport system permease protein